MKKFISKICLILAALMAVVFSGCGLFGDSEKQFSKAGMTITLNDKFYEKDHIGVTVYYESETSIVTVLKEEFSAIGTSSLTASDYADAVITSNYLTVSKQTNDKYAYFSYEKSVSGKEFYYYATCHKGTDAYWLIQFACETKNKDSFQEDFEKWADTISFE